MEELIEVRLYDREVSDLQKTGSINIYGITELDPELNLGRSILPERFVPLFCGEEHEPDYPAYYSLREEKEGYEYTQSGLKLLWEVYTLRYVPGYWTISDSDYLHVFVDEDRCLAYLRSRKNFNGFVVRSADGSQRKIQITISLVK